MSLLIFPSRKNPQFYLTNQTNVIQFFIRNFLFTKRPEIQSLINMTNLYVPDVVKLFVLKKFLYKTNQLPLSFIDALDSIQEFFSVNAETFSLDSAESPGYSYIMRIGAWQRQDDKFVILLFNKQNDKPFAVAKVGSIKYHDDIGLEYVHTKKIYNNFKHSSFRIPEPIALYTSHRLSIYLERFLDGIILNNYLKSKFSAKEKEKAFLDVLNWCMDFLTHMIDRQDSMTSQEFTKYFFDPIEKCLKTKFGTKHSSKLFELKSQVVRLKEAGLSSVPMHGDLWGGSILFDGETIAVIDWEFFSEKGVPLWDFFSLTFHVGAKLHDSIFDSSDFMNYFSNSHITQRVDELLKSLCFRCGLKIEFISSLFQCYLLFNMKRDTDTETYWQDCLERYWGIAEIKGAVPINRIL